MTGIISDIKRFAVHDGDGIRTTLFLKGCPLRCVWCHNPEGLRAEPQMAFFADKCTCCGRCAAECPSGAHVFAGGEHKIDRTRCTACGRCAEDCLREALRLYGRRVTEEEVLPLLTEDRAFYTGGGGVTLSGGECLMQADFCAALLEKLKKEGINTAVDTCGCVSRSAFDKVLPFTDTFLYDIKAIDPEIHRACTGTDNGRILSNLAYICAHGARVEIRFPLVTGLNDGEAEPAARLLQTLDGICGVRVLKYHDMARSKYASLGMEDTMPHTETTDADVRAAQEIFRRAGLRVTD